MSNRSKAEEKREENSEFLEFLNSRARELEVQQDNKRASSIALMAAREQLFLENLNNTLGKLLSRKYSVGKEYSPKKKIKTQRVINIALSDLHYGAMLDNKEVPIQYKHQEESRRTAAVVQQVAEFKRQYRDETELIVHLLGDIIQNKLHDPRDGSAIAEQMSTAIHLLTQALVFLAGQFKKVTVYCTTGNHGRDTSRSPGRVVLQKWDSLESVIYFSVKTAVSHLKNITVVIPKTPYYTYEVFGMQGFMTHGDTVLNPGYPNKSIDVEKVRRQINEINGKLAPDKRYTLFGVGHVHVYSMVRLPNRVTFMSNGCLIPTDSFAQSIGIMDTACCQAIWESVDGHIVGDRREANVDEGVDKDKDLDLIIQPFNGL